MSEGELNETVGTVVQLPDNLNSPSDDVDGLHPGTGESDQGLANTDLGALEIVSQAEVIQSITVKHSIVAACGHKLDMRHFPTMANCEDCWFAFFELAVSKEMMGKMHLMLIQRGKEGIAAVFGKKFLKHYGRYLGAKMIEQRVEQAEETNTSPSIEGSIMSVAEEMHGVR